MWHKYKSILNIIFPLSNDEELINDIDSLPNAVNQHQNQGIISLSSYKNPFVRASIHLTKYHNHPKAKRLLSELLNNYLETINNKEFILISIPLSQKRQRERGYNQVTEVLKLTLKKRTDLIMINDILYRKKHTIPQTSLTRDKRLKNMVGAFGAHHKNKNLLIGKHILLIDDVMTTGATLREAKAALLPLLPSSITCLAFAH